MSEDASSLIAISRLTRLIVTGRSGDISESLPYPEACKSACVVRGGGVWRRGVYGGREDARLIGNILTTSGTREGVCGGELGLGVYGEETGLSVYAEDA